MNKMKTQIKNNRLLLVPLFAVLIASIASAQISDKMMPQSIYTDRRAINVGDIVTILLMEYSQGSNESSTNTGVENVFEGTSAGTGFADIIPTFGLKTGFTNDSKGGGGTTRQGSLKGKLSARIVEILPNNNVRLEGQRKVIINGEEQTTVLTGLVRRNDIAADNSIYSYLISDAAISYKGNGVVDSAAKPGFLTRFINWLF